MNIVIHANETTKKIDNFWNHIHFHPTDAVEDKWGKAVLENVHKDKVARYVRLHTMFEDIVTRDKCGKLAYNFVQSDIRLDYMVKKGFKLLLCFDFMPPCMALDQRNVSNLRYKYKTYNRSQPSDYNEWADICSRYTEHLIERYGIETISDWYFHCWNEPDSGYWVNPKDNDKCDADGDTDKIDEYLKLYDYFEFGVTRITDKVKIGGPSVAGSDRFFEAFINHIVNGKNQANGSTRIRCDFISVHCYSQGIYSNLPNKSFTSPDNIIGRMQTLHAIMEKYGIGDKEIVLDEWGIAGGGFMGVDQDPRFIFRENEYFSAFYARLIEQLIKAPHLNISKMMVCLSGQDHSTNDFDGYRTFFTANGYKKPIYNAYALCAKLGENILSFDTEEETENTGIIPTITENGELAILAYNFCDNFYGEVDNIEMNITVKGLDGEYRLRHYRIDHATSNSHSKWAELRCPQKPTLHQKDMIHQAGELSLFLPDKNIKPAGDYQTQTVLTKNSVSLIVISPA